MGPQETSSRQNKLLAALRKDGAFADAMLVVGKNETPVHRAVLSVLSPFFRAIFQQCASSSQGLPRITLQHASEESGGVLVDYAYGLDISSACEKSLDLALDVANLAATLSIPGLCEAGCRAALYLVRSPDYPRCYYALRLFGRTEDATKCLNIMARDSAFWRATSGIGRLAAPDLEALLRSPDIIASEDDILIGIADWVTVDPSTREKPLVQNILPLLKSQRLTARSSNAFRLLSRHVTTPNFLNLLIGSNSRPTSVPPGAEMGSKAVVARAHGGTNSTPLLGAPLDWMTEEGKRAFINSPYRQYPIRMVSSQYFVMQLCDVTGASLTSELERYFYMNFLSLCLRLRVVLNRKEFFIEPVIERRHLDDCSDTEGPSVDLLTALRPIVLIFESALAFQHATPLQNAFSVWHAPKIAINAPSTVVKLPNGTAPQSNGGPGCEPPAKRQRTLITPRQMQIMGEERRKMVYKAIDNGDFNALTLTLCIRSTKYSALTKNRYIVQENVAPSGS